MLNLNASVVGVQSGIATVLNNKLRETDVQIELRVNNTTGNLDIHDKSVGSGATKIADRDWDLAARFGLTKTTQSDIDIVSALAGAEPGGIGFIDRNGLRADFRFTQADLDAITDAQSVVDMFNNKIAAFNAGRENDEPLLEIVVELNAAGDGLVIKDTTGESGEWAILRLNPQNIINRIKYFGFTSNCSNFIFFFSLFK